MINILVGRRSNMAKKYKRIFVIVADSLGIGYMKDAHLFNDVGANTFVHIAEKCGGLNIPTLNSLGINDLAVVVDTDHKREAVSIALGHGLEDATLGSAPSSGNSGGDRGIIRESHLIEGRSLGKNLQQCTRRLCLLLLCKKGGCKLIYTRKKKS